MKEVLQGELISDVEVVVQAEVKKKRETWGKIHPGHLVFEWDVKEGIIKPAQVEETTFEMDTGSGGKVHKKIIIKEGCHYTPALNAQNAEKRFKKAFGIK